jgi:cytochrome c oxidase assembly factor CtaG
VITTPSLAWAAHAVVLWTWHLPALYEGTLDSDLVHTAQHASFLVTALLFWYALLHGSERRLKRGVAVLYLFGTALHSGILGALLTFADYPWYARYAGTTPAWGLTPLEDQQLAGLIMWIPGGVTYLVAALALVAAWMTRMERRGPAGG